MICKVIAGDYEGKIVQGYHIKGRGSFHCIPLGKGFHAWSEYVVLEDDIAKYEVIDEDIRKSAASGVARGLVGGALLGPVGMLAGGLSAKSKGKYQIAVEFKDGKRSLIEADKQLYNAIVKMCF